MTEPLDLDAIQARADAATPGPWEARPHHHPANGCRCLGCYDDPVGWTLDHDAALHCDDLVAKRSAAGETNDFGRDLDSCDDGPLLSYEDATFAAHARRDVPALLAEIRRLRAELDQARQQAADAIVSGLAEVHDDPETDERNRPGLRSAMRRAHLLATPAAESGA